MFHVSLAEASLVCGFVLLLIVVPFLLARRQANLERRLRELEKRLKEKK
jgi:hypothetical protein